MSRKSVLSVLWGIPVLTIAASYGYLVYEHGTVWLGDVVIHESGRYTLWETVFYSRHFVRELLVCLMMAFGIAAAFALGASTSSACSAAATARRRSDLRLICGALILVAGAGAHAISQEGVQGFMLDALQFRTRDTSVAYGSHWQYHLLHVVFMFTAALALVHVLCATSTGRLVRPHRRSIGGCLAWVGCFLGLTVIFSLSARPFVDPLYLAHQAREIATHGLVTLPAVAGVLVRTTGGTSRDQSTGIADVTLLRRGLVLAVVPLGICVYVLVRLHGVDVEALAARQSGYADLFASHVFEHVLDYLMVLMLAPVMFNRIRFGSLRGSSTSGQKANADRPAFTPSAS